jgi:hypothetical protein
LIVIKHVDNSGGNGRGISNAPDFTLHINGNNPSPTDFPGLESGTNIALGAGQYAVTETKPVEPRMLTGSSQHYIATYSSDCTGTINDGQTKTCTVTNSSQQ